MQATPQKPPASCSLGVIRLLLTYWALGIQQPCLTWLLSISCVESNTSFSALKSPQRISFIRNTEGVEIRLSEGKISQNRKETWEKNSAHNQWIFATLFENTSKSKKVKGIGADFFASLFVACNITAILNTAKFSEVRSLNVYRLMVMGCLGLGLCICSLGDERMRGAKVCACIHFVG